MKKIITFINILVLIILVTGCSDVENNNANFMDYLGQNIDDFMKMYPEFTEDLKIDDYIEYRDEYDDQVTTYQNKIISIAISYKSPYQIDDINLKMSFDEAAQKVTELCSDVDSYTANRDMGNEYRNTLGILKSNPEIILGVTSEDFPDQSSLRSVFCFYYDFVNVRDAAFNGTD